MHTLLMSMLVMGIMRMPMVMRERLVPVSMQMLLRQVQPHARPHEPRRNPEP